MVDKVNLAFIGFLDPDSVFGIATGQLASARRSNKDFDRVFPKREGNPEWTMTQAFYADMGGFLLCSPDYPNGFPINAEQLLYLVVHGHMDFPSLTEAEIKEKSKADSLSKFVSAHYNQKSPKS